MSTAPIGKNDIINQANHPSEVVGYKLLKPEEKRMILPLMIEQVVVSKGHGVEIVFRSVIKELCQMKV